MATTVKPTRPKRTSAKPQTGDQASRYARDVVAGRVMVGRLVRLACQRHLSDLARDDLTWDTKAAKRAIGFFRDVLRLNGGEFEGAPFVLSPWQAFIVGSLFGWHGPDGYRRFRVAYIEVAKGNGKSPLAAGVGHYMLSADKEPRAEVYAAATKKDQAMILFRDAVAMWEQSPSLKSRLKASGQTPNVWNLADINTGSFYRPISSDDGQSGPRPHCGLIDEVHEHKTAHVVDQMRAGTKGRTQALIFEITNSGFDRHSVCGQHHEYSTKVLEDVIQDDSWFAYVCGIDACEECRTSGKARQDCTKCDQWTDERVWPKANPNLGVSVTLKYLREQVREAVGMPGKQNVVRRLNLCEWTEQDERWLDMTLWDSAKGSFDVDALRGRPCYAGLDLAKVNDLSALALLFPPSDAGEKWKAIFKYWVPKDDIAKRAKKDRVPYDVWVRDGHITATVGNATDFDFIDAAIVAAHATYDLREVAYDRHFAERLEQRLMGEGITVVPFGQGFVSMSPPTNELSRMLLAGEIEHLGDPVTRWCASNLVVSQDPAGNLKPDKDRSTEKIDGMTALVMSIGRGMLLGGEGPSVYETRGLLEV